MTTLAYKAGIMAADSRETLSTEEGGDRVTNPRSPKLFRVNGAICATAGDTSAGLVFLDWYRRGAKKKERPDFSNADAFDVIVLDAKGLRRYDEWCFAEELDPMQFYAWGSGAKAALGALYAGASAERAVEIACAIDPWSALPVVIMRHAAGR